MGYLYWMCRVIVSLGISFWVKKTSTTNFTSCSLTREKGLMQSSQKKCSTQTIKQNTSHHHKHAYCFVKTQSLHKPTFELDIFIEQATSDAMSVWPYGLLWIDTDLRRSGAWSWQAGGRALDSGQADCSTPGRVCDDSLSSRDRMAVHFPPEQCWE